MPGNSSDLNPLENLWAVIKMIGDFSSRDVLSECEREGTKIDQTTEDICYHSTDQYNINNKWFVISMVFNVH